MTKTALIGLGEAGNIIAAQLGQAGHVVCFFDLGAATPGHPARRHAEELGLSPDDTLEQAVSGAEAIFSAVTPGSCLAAAEQAASFISPGAWFVDLNSASPGHKSAAARAVTAAGGRYVEAALMSPVLPAGLASPFLLGGPEAPAFAAEAPAYAMTNATVTDAPLGSAAATKLCRSVVVKGLEALVTESLLAASRLGVRDAVVASLANLLPVDDWGAYSEYLVSRTLTHGVRRAEEMGEAAAMLREAGVEPVMSEATTGRQLRAGTIGATLPTRDLSHLLIALTDEDHA